VPTREQHVTKADGNAAFALSLPLENQTQIEWALVALFYAAMHYIEAYLAPNTHLRSHEARDKYVGRESHLRLIFKEYSHLKYFSVNASYEICTFRAEDVQNEASRDYETIKRHIGTKL